MKHIRLQLTLGEGTIHPLFTMITSREFINGARMVDWNVADPEQPRLLFAIDGDRDAVRAELASMDAINDFEVTPVGENQFFLHVWPEPTPVSRALFELYQGEDLMIVHPIEYIGDSAYVSILGESATLQRALDRFGTGLGVAIERIGGFPTGREAILTRLSPRQRDAVELGIELGYYRHPREATHEDIADRMGCAPNTVTAHLQKAEAKLLAALVE